MAPDLNSLPPSRSPEHPPLQIRVFSNTTDPHRRQTPSPRSSSISLAAAATINAGIQQQHQDSRRSSTSNRPSPQLGRTERRRSNVAMSLNFNDPTLPGPGELAATDHRSSIGHSFRTTSPHSIGGSPTVATGDPHHQRAPSLGELHQELEQEQEAQVNRLLLMIRQQQAQLLAMQSSQSLPSNSTTTAAIDDSTTPTSERSFSFPSNPAPSTSAYPTYPPHPSTTHPISITNPRPRSPIPRSSIDLSRQSSRRSRTSSRGNSPSLRPLSGTLHPHGGEEWLLGATGTGTVSGRDESAFYQAETTNLTRENQMLRARIRELERQISEINATPVTMPATPSNLAVPPMEAGSAGGSSEEERRSGEEEKAEE